MDTPSTAESIHQAMNVLRYASRRVGFAIVTAWGFVCRGDMQTWDLQSLLIKPVQRVLKYPLLLDKIVESTPDSHPDYQEVYSAKEAIAKVAQDINEIKRRKDLGECGQLASILE